MMETGVVVDTTKLVSIFGVNFRKPLLEKDLGDVFFWSCFLAHPKKGLMEPGTSAYRACKRKICNGRSAAGEVPPCL